MTAAFTVRSVGETRHLNLVFTSHTVHLDVEGIDGVPHALAHFTAYSHRSVSLHHQDGTILADDDPHVTEHAAAIEAIAREAIAAEGWSV